MTASRPSGPTVLVVMGVSGSGKSTVAALLARTLGWPFAEGDDFHSPESIARMKAGHPLDDGWRRPWLERIRAWIDARLAAGEHGIVACSALKRAYRTVLTGDRPEIRIVFLEGSRAVIQERVRARHGHFMPASLLDSQFAALEPPGPEEDPITVGIEDGPDAIVAAVAARLGRPIGAVCGKEAPMPIALVVSDVDGTLVTDDKQLTPAALAAVRRLGAAGIGFTLASSRPPVGLKHLVEALDLRLPIAAFNGSTVCGPDLAPISETLIPEAVAREAVRRLDAEGIDVWVFADGAWTLRDPSAPYADLERRTLRAEPKVLPDLSPLLGRAAKIVGVSRDHARLGRIETRLAEALQGRAAVHRSQPYYLDVTPPGLDKGRFVADLGRRLGIPRERIATLGDAANDIPLFRESGLSIAMGNAAPAVKQAATAVTDSNQEDGFAHAINRLVLAKT